MTDPRFASLADRFFSLVADTVAPQDAEHPPVWVPTTDDELDRWLQQYLGVRLPRKVVCTGHTSPFQAVADAYFARTPRAVWLASRGFGGKSVALAALSMAEALTLNAGVTLLGGSGEQSARVLAHMNGEDTMRGRFWAHPNAPRHLLRGDPTKRLTRLQGGGWINALMASQASVRGPHPQRLRGDEIDEMDPTLWRAAQGQPQESQGILEQTVGSSTHHNPNGTMTAELQSAAEKGWPVYTWCWRETSAAGGFVTPLQVERKRAVMVKRDFETEYDLQQPNPEGLAIDADSVEAAFSAELGTYAGALNRKLVLEAPATPEELAANGEEEEPYVTGVDFGRDRDKTIVWTVRKTVTPVRLVCFQHLGRLPYPQMVAQVQWQVRTYPGLLLYDKGGVGRGVEDFLTVRGTGIDLVGKIRSEIFEHWIAALEHRHFLAPRIEYAYREHRFVTVADLYGAGHPPDTFIAGALANHGVLMAGAAFR